MTTLSMSRSRSRGAIALGDRLDGARARTQEPRGDGGLLRDLGREAHRTGRAAEAVAGRVQAGDGGRQPAGNGAAPAIASASAASVGGRIP